MEDEPLGPGLHRQRAADPSAHASALAVRLDAVLCSSRSDAEIELTHRRAELAPTADALASLASLAGRLERTARISSRTRARAEAQVAERVATVSAGLAVHPATIRARAAAVETARLALADAEQAIAAEVIAQAAAEGDPPTSVADQVVADQVVADQGAVTTPAGSAGPSLATRRNRAIGAVLAAAGIGMLLVGFRITALWAALLPLLGACLWAVRYLGPRSSDDRGERSEASALLAEVGASTDQLFGARRAAQEDARTEMPSPATVRRDRALEELRVAERAWHELAGDEVDAAAVEEVVRRYDPQHEDARVLAADAVAVRATLGLLQKLEQQWVAAWSELGAEAPEPAGAAAALHALLRRASRPVLLVGDAAAHADELVRAAPRAPVVVVDRGEPDVQPGIS